MSILVTLLVAIIVGGLIWYLIRMLPLPAPFKAILYLIGMLTGIGGLAPIRIG
jgi:hypothetical protein